jgi:hypothetical protein
MGARGELSAATTIGFVMNFSFYRLLFVETLLLERVYGFSPLVTGVALLPQTGIIAAGSWLGGVVTGRSGPKVPMAVGMAVGAAGGALGIALLGSFVAAAAGMLSGARVAMVVAGAAYLLGFVVALTVRRDRAGQDGTGA